MDLTSRLQQFINLQKITKLQIARELNLSEPTIHRWFKTFKIPVSAIKHLVDKHKLNPLWFFTGTGSQILTEESLVDGKATKDDNLMLQGEVRALEKQHNGNNFQILKILKTLTEDVAELSEAINIVDNNSQKVEDKMFQIYPAIKN